MAIIRPFAALRFDTSKVRLEDVLTQPYDKITPAMQDAYYARSPHSLISLELGQAGPADHAQDNVYTRAARFLQQSVASGVLVRDPEPSFYFYAQRFEVPGSPGHWRTRSGFIGLCRLYDYPEHVVFRHEQTLSRPKADRLDLLRATRTHSGQIFLLYPDPESEIDTLLARAIDPARATASMVDEYDVRHTLWRINDPMVCAQLQALMKDKRLIIADGHHRYETALAYRNECRARHLDVPAEAGRTGQLHVDGQAPYEFVMATFINMDSPDLLILPTHRVVFGLPRFDPAAMIDAARTYFDLEGMPAGLTAETAMNSLAALAPARTSFVAATSAGAWLLKARRTAIDHLLARASHLQCELDVVQLHAVLLQEVLGISAEAIRDQTHLQYLRSPQEALDRVRQGADVAFLMNPVRMAQMRDVAFAGEVMPQKSTDFYPKLMSGLTLYALD
jgi:uncharacterized protein (DUF1015 family)